MTTLSKTTTPTHGALAGGGSAMVHALVHHQPAPHSPPPGLAEIVEEVAGVAQDDVTAEKSFVDDLDIDSLSMVEIAVQAEDKFGVKIPDDELANLKTVGDAVNYVAANSK